MNIAGNLKTSRERRELSQEVLAAKLNVPVAVLCYLENPAAENHAVVNLFAEALEMTADQFLGKEEIPRDPSEVLEETVAQATYPNLRRFLLAENRCETVERVTELFAAAPLSSIEKSLTLHFAITALTRFSETDITVFELDKYLGAVHGQALNKLEAELQSQGLSPAEREERLGFAHGSVFACDSAANLALLVVKDFTKELEAKIERGETDFYDEIGLPFTWVLNDDATALTIRNQDGETTQTYTLR